MRKREEERFYPELDRYRMRKDPNFGKEEEEEEEGEGFAARRVTEASISHRNTHPLTHTSCPYTRCLLFTLGNVSQLHLSPN